MTVVLNDFRVCISASARTILHYGYMPYWGFPDFRLVSCSGNPEMVSTSRLFHFSEFQSRFTSGQNFNRWKLPERSWIILLFVTLL
jgi:hypothetical protein